MSVAQRRVETKPNSDCEWTSWWKVILFPGRRSNTVYGATEQRPSKAAFEWSKAKLSTSASTCWCFLAPLQEMKSGGCVTSCLIPLTPTPLSSRPGLTAVADGCCDSTVQWLRESWRRSQGVKPVYTHWRPVPSSSSDHLLQHWEAVSFIYSLYSLHWMQEIQLAYHYGSNWFSVLDVMVSSLTFSATELWLHCI